MAPIAAGPSGATMMVSTVVMAIQPSSASATGAANCATRRTSVRRVGCIAALSAYDARPPEPLLVAGNRYCERAAFVGDLVTRRHLQKRRVGLGKAQIL